MKTASSHVTLQIHFDSFVVKVKVKRNDDAINSAVHKETVKRKNLPNFYTFAWI